MSPTFRNGFFAGLLIALALGLYLFQLWGAENQVQLHSGHLIAALQKNDWPEVREFLGASYHDQWGHDRETLIARMRAVLPYARNLQIQPREIVIRVEGREAEWRARVTLEADPNEVSALIKERVNTLEDPFVLKWRRVSRKPWDWKLVHVANPGLDLSHAEF